METEESKHEGREKGGWGLFRFVWIGCVLLVLYVLSVGPVLKVCPRGLLKGPVYIAYFPITFLCDRCGGVRHLVYWYLFDVWKVPLEPE
jgi:hypothetical protein